jgi:hypothetical protein
VPLDELPYVVIEPSGNSNRDLHLPTTFFAGAAGEPPRFRLPQVAVVLVV